MAQPNLISTSSCYLMHTTFENVATGGTTLLSSATDKQRKIVSMYVCNTAASAVSFSMYFSATGATRYLVHNVSIPPNATLVVISRDAPVHFAEGSHSLNMSASATGIDVHLSYEEYDDA